MSEHHHHHGFHGPKAWVASLLVGLTLGLLLTLVVPPSYQDPHHNEAMAEHGDDHATPAQPDDHQATEHADHSGTPVPQSLAHDEPSVTIAGAPGDGVPVYLPEVHPDSHAEHDAANEAPEHATGEESHGSNHHGPSPVIPLWLCIPFATLLGSIALMPFVSEKVWHRHFPDFAFLLGGITAAYYLFGFTQEYSHGMSYGQYQMLHTAIEYYSFIALIGGLYIASGGVLVTVTGRGGPRLNTSILAFGAVLANIVGTTGASVLLIRPFMRLNKGRLKPIHVVMFIFIVSNCGGALTPIGDPPLYLGFLKGVPFEWTIIHLWPMWATAIGLLLAMFFVLDARIGPAPIAPGAENEPAPKMSFRIKGTSGLICLALIIAGVFIDPLLKSRFGVQGLPIGATFQIFVALAAYLLADKSIHAANEFTFFPVKEVGLLFVGIFATMAPALGFLATHGASLGLTSPGAFYFGTGALSGVLDNAPTYLNFVQVAFGETPITSDNVRAFLADHTNAVTLAAISTGAVFFGAMTYIGNGPNFMVRAIAEAGGLKMPSFFGYIARSVLLLVPVLVTVYFLYFH